MGSLESGLQRTVGWSKMAIFSVFGTQLNSSLLKLQVETSSPTFRVRLKIIISFFTNPEIDDSLNGHLTGLQQNA